MIVGITGISGFIGSRLAAILTERKIGVVGIGRADFEDPGALREKAALCDQIIHFAGLSRHADGNYLYRVNMALADALVKAAQSIPGDTPRLLLASTTHIDRETPYHRSKRDIAAHFCKSGKKFVNLLMPNTFGPGGKPFYNSVVSTFCLLSCRGETPERIDDAALSLIYVDRLADEIGVLLADKNVSGDVRIADQFHETLPRVWELLCGFAAGAKPETPFEKALFLTRESYLSK